MKTIKLRILLSKHQSGELEGAHIDRYDVSEVLQINGVIKMKYQSWQPLTGQVHSK